MATPIADLTGPDAMNLVLLIYPTAAALLIFVIGLGVGQLVLRPWRWRFDSPLEFHCIAGGVGMGVGAHAVLLLGLMGQWRAGGFIALGLVLAGAAVAGFRPFRRNETKQPWWDGRPTPVEVVALGTLAVILACQALRTTTPPANYDVLEYHVGAVQHWLHAGRIFPFPHLFYAALPFEVEMWYATGCFLEGNPLLPATPKLICYGLLLCNLATLYTLASALGIQRPFRLFTCLIFAAHPLASVGAADALNDLGVTWFASLAFLTWLKWLTKRDRVSFVLCAGFLGFTICCKYTAVGLIVFPVFIFLLPVAAFSPPASHLPPPASRLLHLLADWAVAGVIIAAVFWPWAFKNVLHHGNPVYPLVSGWFPSATWSPEQTDFYLAAHGRTNPAHAAYWIAFAHNLLRLGPWLIVAIAAGCFWKRAGVGVIALTAFMVTGILVHSVFPGNPTRFLLPFLPLAAALGACFIEQIHCTATPLRAAVIAPFVFWIGLGALSAVDPPKFRPLALGFERMGLPVFTDAPAAGDLMAYLFSNMTRLEVLGQALGPSVVASRRFINEQTPPNARILLLYEARIAGFDRWVEVGSVFDRSPLVERAFHLRTADQLLDRLRFEGFDYLYVNEFELARLIDTYALPSARQAKPVFFGPGIDIRNAASRTDLYPPYFQDQRFLRCQAVIEDFIKICRGRAIYTISPDFPYGIWIAPLK